MRTLQNREGAFRAVTPQNRALPLSRNRRIELVEDLMPSAFNGRWYLSNLKRLLLGNLSKLVLVGWIIPVGLPQDSQFVKMLVPQIVDLVPPCVGRQAEE